MEQCKLCPRACLVNRLTGQVGRCHETATVRIARAALHFWEEPCLSGTRGSGAVFFTGCSLGCVYCQNGMIANGSVGKEVSIENLAHIMLKLQREGALNINLVTGTHFIPQICEALQLAKQQGLSIPIVYNTSGYEEVESLRMLEGFVDIYLPDLKYVSKERAKAYSHAEDYPKKAMNAIGEMVRQVGNPSVTKEGIMERGVIVRHLVLPLGVKEAKQVLSYLWNTYQNQIYVSLMSQYTPVGVFAVEEKGDSNEKVDELHIERSGIHALREQYPELCRCITKREYQRVLDYAMELGMEQVYIQEREAAKESFIPEFDLTGL